MQSSLKSGGKSNMVICFIEACYKAIFSYWCMLQGKSLHDKLMLIPIKYCMNNCKLDLFYFEGQSFSKEIKWASPVHSKIDRSSSCFCRSMSNVMRINFLYFWWFNLISLFSPRTDIWLDHQLMLLKLKNNSFPTA